MKKFIQLYTICYFENNKTNNFHYSPFRPPPHQIILRIRIFKFFCKSSQNEYKPMQDD